MTEVTSHLSAMHALHDSKLLNWKLAPAVTKRDIKKMSKAEMTALLMELMEK